MPSASPCPTFLAVPAAKTASGVRLVAFVIGKFAAGSQKVEDVFKLLLVVVSLDFFMFDWLTECESSQAIDRKWTLESVEKRAFNTYIFSCLTLLSLISRFYCLNCSI